MANFSRGAATLPASPGGSFDAGLLDDETKKKLCLDLLSEIGAQNVRQPTARGEIVHSCPIPDAHAHGDRNPSASLNYKKLAFRCLGCGAKGGVLWFISLVRGEHDALAARTWLGEQTGLDGHVLEKHKILEQLDSIFNRQALRAEEMPVYPASAMDPWTWSEPHPYLTDSGTHGGIACRGIPAENCRRFGVGYAEHYPMGYEHGPDGRLLRDPDGSPVPRETQERIVIPIRWDGQLVGWQARAIRPEDGRTEKYKNSVGCPRQRVVYGWEGSNRDQVLVESPMSVLRHCHHQPMIATFGKAVTDEQCRTLARARSLVVWFDADPGGWEGTERLIAALARSVPLRVVEFPYRGTDPADLPDDAVDRFVKSAVPWSLWRRPETLTEWKDMP